VLRHYLAHRGSGRLAQALGTDLMLLRIVGVFLLLAGLAVTGFGVYGFSVTHAMAEQFSLVSQASGAAFDILAWSSRWQLWSAIFVGVGVATLVAGFALTRKRPWGLLVFAVAAAFTAMFPWVFMQLGTARYAFEAASIRESLALAAVTLVAVLAFVRLRSRVST
jgi:hypothetical protein